MIKGIDERAIESASKKNILTYGISYIDLLENQQWKVDTRAWIKEIFDVVNPYDIEKSPIGLARQLVIQKSTQCGMTTMAATRMFHFADFWPVRIIYMLPRQRDYLDFVNTRINPMILNSHRLRDLKRDPDSIGAKGFGNSFLFFMESTVEPRMMPADAVFIDEYDLSNLIFVSSAHNRMDNSNWRLSFRFSTPTLPNFGINALYNVSDKRQWFIKCDSCGHYQVMSWDKNLRIVGSDANPKKVFFGCEKCDRELTLPLIQKGFWVPEYPERSGKSIGFHISQLMTHSADHLYQVYRDPETSIREFYRKNLGMPIEIGSGSLSREDILANCMPEEVTLETQYDGSSRYYMGVDQGNELQVLICKVPRKEQTARIVHIETVPFDKGFKRIGELIRLFKVRKAVIDADPNRHSARDLQKDYLGVVLLADYSSSTIGYSLRREETDRVDTRVVIGRSEGFDGLMESIRNGAWMIPGTLSSIPKETEWLIDHITSIKRDIQIVRRASGEKEEVVWAEMRPSHLAHAWLYVKIAKEISEGKSFNIAVINPSSSASSESSEFIEEGGPLKKHVIEITALLAEVPTTQLKWFTDNHQERDYNNMPFPLSHKLKLARTLYLEADILWVARFILRDRFSII